MNANRTPRLRACVACFALALGLLAPGSVLAEVGVATRPGSLEPLVVYVVNGSTEDPSPINPVWRKLGPMDEYRITLNPAGEAAGDGTPSLLKDEAAGRVAAAWSRNSASGFDVVVSRFEGGAWTTPQVVAASSSNELDPQLVLDPDGSLHLFYWVDGTTPQVFHAIAAADWTSWSAAASISQPGQPACRPAGTFHNGVLRVAYEIHNFGNGNSPRQVVLARYENGEFITEVVAMTDNLGDVRPQVHSHAGRLWVDWVDFETTGGSGEIGWTRYDALGEWETIQYDPFADREHRDFLTRGAARLQAIE